MWIRNALSLVCLLVYAAAVLAAPEVTQPTAKLSSASNTSTLTNAAQILQLSPAPANVNSPVRIEGVITCYDPGRVLFVQDDTAGVFVYYTGDRLPLRTGQYVQVTGLASRGRFSPIIASPVIQAVKSGPAITPQTVSLAQVQYGGLDAQWVELEAVVRSQKFIDNRLWLEVADPPHRIPVWVADPQVYEQQPLVGGSVRVRGVVGSRVNDRGQLEGFQLYASSLADIIVLHPRAENPFATPLRPIQDVTSSDARSSARGYIRVRGVVTLCQPGRAVFIQDATGGLEVLAQSLPANLSPGTVVEAAGYPGPILESPRLEDAQIRRLETFAAPQPVRLLADDPFQDQHNNQLIAVEGHYLGRSDAPSNSIALAVRANGRYLTARLDTPQSSATLTGLEPGCTLHLTGVCRLQAGPGDDSAASLLLRSPMDVKVIRPPAKPRATAVPVLVAITLLTGASLAVALLFIQKQRRQTENVLQLQASLLAEIREGEQQLRHSVEDRERIGRDLHDDIIQSIYAAGLGLEDCRRVVRHSPEQAEARLTTAIQMLNNTIRGVRSFIAGLEPKVLSGHEFKTALKSLALTCGDSPTQFQFQVDTAGANSLTSPQATQLLHIAKEAMSNSLRHAQSSSIIVSLQPVGSGVRLEIRDDGVGFDPAAVSGTGQGLRNMAVRAREIGGELQTISSPGQGCRILVTVPQRNLNESD